MSCQFIPSDYRNLGMATEKHKRIIYLDVIRGMAALTVFLSHLGSPDSSARLIHGVYDIYSRLFETFFAWKNGIHPGVLIFIVLSGFCIHLPNSSKKEISWNKYFKRRFVRIYPVMFFAMIMGLMNSDIVLFEHAEFCKRFVTDIFLLPGLLPVNVSGPLGNQPLITVIIECLLYIFYPIGLLIARTKGWKEILSFALLVYVSNFIVGKLLNFESSWICRNYYSFLLYWWIGAFGVEYLAEIKQTYLKQRYIFVIYLLFILVFNSISVKGSHYIRNIFMAFFTVYLLSVLSGKDLPKNILSKKIILFMSDLGEKSYSLYAIHIPILYWIKNSILISGIESASLKYLLNIMMVYFSTLVFYHLIEKPFHRLALFVSRK